MKTLFETEVSEALASRASDLPLGAVGRVCAVDYRPRQSRVRRPAALGAVAGAATAGTVLSVVVLGGAPAAYAGWSATPSADTTPSATTTTDCQNQLSASGPGDQAAPSGSWQNVLTDVRGPFTVALYQDGDAYAACFTGSSFTVVNQLQGDPASGSASGKMSVQMQSSHGGAPNPAPSVSIWSTSSGVLQAVAQSHLTTSSDGPYTLLDGRAQSGVTGVTLALDDGQDVTATVADGWFVAWWPGSATATSAQITTASGTTAAPFVSQPKLSAPANPGNTATSGGTGSTGSTGNTGTGKSGPG